MSLTKPAIFKDALPGLLFLLAIWLFTHPYRGIWHDGLLYAGQALFNQTPERFSNDLFFGFGSQDTFTLFTRLYGALATHLGLGISAMILLIIAHIAWISSSAYLVSGLLRGTAWWVGMALLFAAPRGYGPEGLLSYAETFLTARSWAEPFVLLTLACAYREKYLAAWATAFAAMICHPIIGFPSLLFLLLFQRKLKWQQVSLLAIAGSGLCFLLPQMDAHWLHLVRIRSPFVFVDDWSLYELGEPLAYIAILGIAARNSSHKTAYLWRCAALIGVFSFLLAYLACLSDAKILIQSQPWRGLWVVKVMALIGLVDLFASHWQSDVSKRWLLLSLAAAAMSATTLGGPGALLIFFLFTPETAALLKKPPRWLQWGGLIAIGVVAGETCLAALQHFAHGVFFAQFATALPNGSILRSVVMVLDSPLALLLPLFLLWLIRFTPSNIRVAMLIGICSVGLGLVAWHQNNDPDQKLLFAQTPSRPFGTQIPDNATVFWDGNFDRTWFLLKQANYASIHQSAGLLFSRDTAIESEQRLAKLRTFGSADGQISWRQSREAIRPQITQEKLVELCMDSHLDFVVLKQAIPTLAPIDRWDDTSTHLPYLLYNCKQTATAT